MRTPHSSLSTQAALPKSSLRHTSSSISHLLQQGLDHLILVPRHGQQEGRLHHCTRMHQPRRRTGLVPSSAASAQQCSSWQRRHTQLCATVNTHKTWWLRSHPTDGQRKWWRTLKRRTLACPLLLAGSNGLERVSQPLNHAQRSSLRLGGRARLRQDSPPIVKWAQSDLGRARHTLLVRACTPAPTRLHQRGTPTTELNCAHLLYASGCLPRRT